MVAVIDKIPYPRISEISQEHDQFSNHNGCEGISVLAGQSEDLAPDLWTPRADVGERETMAVQQPGTLSFAFKPSAANMAFIAENGLEGQVPSYELGMPVANTLFHNGHRSTFYAEQWKPSTSATGFSRVRKDFLQQQTVHLGRLFPTYSDIQFKLLTTLKPIVPARIIAAAMGNVIRKFYTGSGSNPEETVPASRELEEAVSQYIETSQKIDIWALVTPREYTVSGPRVRPDFQKLIENGSRLHKVLSGGGGWGIKEGLLALDPDCDYSPPENKIQTGLGEDQTKDLAGAQICRDIVKPGDQVTFLTPIPLVESNHLGTPREHWGSWNVRSPSAAVFGTLPSRMDSMPNSDSASSQPNLPYDYLLVRNHFGMLSEHGMSVKVHNNGFDDSGNYGAEQLGVVVRTKLDAPYSIFSASTTGPAQNIQPLHFGNGDFDPTSDPKDELDARKTKKYDMTGEVARSLGFVNPAIYERARKIENHSRKAQSQPAPKRPSHRTFHFRKGDVEQSSDLKDEIDTRKTKLDMMGELGRSLGSAKNDSPVRIRKIRSPSRIGSAKIASPGRVRKIEYHSRTGSAKNDSPGRVRKKSAIATSINDEMVPKNFPFSKR